MLISWMSHDAYCSFISQGIIFLSFSDLIRLRGSFSDSLDKLTSLDLDPVRDLLLTHYSNTGRPAQHQPQILRSFLLMGDLKETSIKNWVHILHSDPLMAFLIGCSPDSVPSLGSYYDFIDRLWLRSKEIQKQERLKEHKFIYEFPNLLNLSASKLSIYASYRLMLLFTNESLMYFLIVDAFSVGLISFLSFSINTLCFISIYYLSHL